MPDILIRGMEMPKSCAGCDFYNVISGCCTRTGTKITFSELTTRSVDCPLVELPPHGDLIQRSDVLAVVDEAYEYGVVIKRKDFDEQNIPTIVPAEREGEA